MNDSQICLAGAIAAMLMWFQTGNDMFGLAELALLICYLISNNHSPKGHHNKRPK